MKSLLPIRRLPVFALAMFATLAGFAAPFAATPASVHAQALRTGAHARTDIAALMESVASRSRLVTATFDGATLDVALSEIGRQSGVPVMYGEDVFQATVRVSVPLRNASFARALDAVLRDTDFTATPAPGGHGVLVHRAPDEAAAVSQVIADTLRGRVVEADNENQGVADVEILVDGTRAAVTDQAGRYALVLEPGTYSITVSKIGFAKITREIRVPLGEPALLIFQLAIEPLSLTELVVTGVADPIEGVKLPFTVGRIDGEDVAAVPAPGSPLATLQGKVAGVRMVQRSGQPGEEPEILLRTPTSIQKSNAPMIIVDGVILASTYVTPSVDISALDIESIEVVKGAAAASLYGSRAANGVIQIRTKRGSDLGLGETRIRARTEMGISRVPTDLPLATHHFFVTNEQGQFLDAGGNVTTDLSERVIADDRIIDNVYGVPVFDNVETFFEPGTFMTNSITLSQNHESTNFALTLANNDEGGSLENNNGLQSRNVRLNIDHRIGDDLSIGASAYHSRFENDLVTGVPYLDLLTYAPEVNLGERGPDGNFVQLPDPTFTEENPIWTQASRDDSETRARTLGNLQARYAPLDWLSFNGNVSYDRTELGTRRYTPKGTPLSVTTDNPSDGSLQLIRSDIDALNASFNTNLVGTLGDLTARLNLTAFMEREKNDFVSAVGRDFFVPGVPTLGSAADLTSSSSLTEIRSDGYFAQTGLDYADRYIVDLLVRRDGSSLFGEANRWQTYYRGAAAYRLSEEPWFDVPGINELKLRYARGTAGGRPDFDDRFETWFVFSSGAISRGALGNRDLRPSKTTEQEIGIDLIALDRYSLQLSYIDQTTEDQLISIPVPAVTGFTSQVRNAGTMSGTTWEATLEAQLLDEPDLRWTATLVADRSRSTIEEWGRSCYVTQLVRYCAGSSMSDIWGRRFLQSPADLPAVHAGSQDAFEVNDDGYLVPVGAGNSWRDGMSQDLWGTTVTIDGITYQWGQPIVLTDAAGLEAVELIGSSAPDVSFGWLNDVSWRGFDLHTHLHAQVGGQVYNNTRQRLYAARRHGDLDQSGKPDERKKPEPYYFALYNSNAVSEPFLEDGSFLKLRELSLEYNFTAAQLARIGLGNLGPERITVGVIGRNLLTLTDYTGFDPEVGSVLERYDAAGYPNMRTFTGAIEITF